MSVSHQSAVRSLTRLFSTSATKYKPYIPKNEHKFKFEQLKIWEHVYGISSVLSALRAKKRSKLNTIFIQASDNKKTKQKKDDSLILEILQLAKTSELKIVSVDKGRLNSLTDNRPHQGVVLRASPIKSIEIDALTNINGTFYEALPKINKRGNQKNKLNSESISNIQFNTPSNGRMPFWIALDEVQDPQNLGSILRTAYFFGVDGVLICSKNSAPLSPTVSKVSSGAVEMMDIYSATNLAKFLKESHTNGWEIIGAVGDAQPSFNPLQFRETYDKPVILVLGNEGTGLRTNIRNECNRFISIPSAIAEEKLNGSVDSLNVGVAAGIIISSALLK